MSPNQTSRPSQSDSTLDRHLLRMRAVAVIALLGPVAMAVIGFVLPRSRSTLISPIGMTLLAAAAALWIVLTANGDASRRLESVKRGFAAHGEVATLLREHLIVYLVVLLRLLCVGLCGLVTAGWGNGPWVAIWFFVANALLVLMTWPTRRKSELLIARATAKG